MSWIAIIIAIVFAFIAFKVLMGLLRVGIIIAIVIVVFILIQQGVVA